MELSLRMIYLRIRARGLGLGGPGWQPKHRRNSYKQKVKLLSLKR